MRTTIRLDDELLAAAKRLAIETNRSLTKVIEDALRETLARKHAPRSKKRVSLPTAGGEGVKPGIELADWSTVKEAIDER